MSEIFVEKSKKIDIWDWNMLETVNSKEEYAKVKKALESLANKLNQELDKDGMFSKREHRDKLLLIYNSRISTLYDPSQKQVGEFIEEIEELVKWPEIQPEVKSELETKVKPESEQEPKQKSQTENQAQETLIASLTNSGLMPQWWKWLLNTIDGTKRGI